MHYDRVGLDPLRENGMVEGLLATLEELAKMFVVARVILWLFIIFAWPFVSISRIIFFVHSLGYVRPSYRKSLEHQGIVLLALIIFISALFYAHLVYGARLYGNLSH